MQGNKRYEFILVPHRQLADFKKHTHEALRTHLKEMWDIENPQLKKDVFGKPYIEEGVPYLSISHTKKYSVIATSSHLLGIDIEHISRFPEESSVAEMIFHPSELSKYQALNSEEQLEYFYKIWTAKEAILKAKGKGFLMSPNEFKLDLLEKEKATFEEFDIEIFHITTDIMCAVAISQYQIV